MFVCDVDGRLLSPHNYSIITHALLLLRESSSNGGGQGVSGIYLIKQVWALINRDSQTCNFLRQIPSFKIHVNLSKLVLHPNHYLINSEFEGIDEIMATEQDEFREVKVDFKTRNSSKKELHT